MSVYPVSTDSLVDCCSPAFFFFVDVFSKISTQTGRPYLTLIFFTAINQLQLFIDLTANCRDAICFSTDVSGNQALLPKKVSTR